MLDALACVVGDLSRLAADIVFFTTGECGFFTIENGYTTGSSPGPPRRNPEPVTRSVGRPTGVPDRVSVQPLRPVRSYPAREGGGEGNANEGIPRIRLFFVRMPRIQTHPIGPSRPSNPPA